MAQLIELSPDQIRHARSREISISTHHIINVAPEDVATLLNIHRDDTIHLFTASTATGELHNGRVVRIDSTDEKRAKVSLTFAGEQAANQLITEGVVAVLFTRDKNLLPPELHSHNGA